MNANRTVIYLHDGRAWVAELKNGRARVSSLTAWLSAHPGRAAVRSLALETLREPTVHVPWSNRARGALSSLLGRALGRPVSPDSHRDPAAG